MDYSAFNGTLGWGGVVSVVLFPQANTKPNQTKLKKKKKNETLKELEKHEDRQVNEALISPKIET